MARVRLLIIIILLCGKAIGALYIPSINMKKAFISIFLTLSSQTTAPILDNGRVDNLGFFATCQSNSYACVSSQDDRPPYFLEPWCYDGSTSAMYTRLLRYLVDYPGCTIISGSENERYLLVQFKNNDQTIDECEFYFTPNDNTIQFHSYRILPKNQLIDFNVNKNRIQLIANKLHLESVPVLRNRRRVLFFIESPFDTFGPPTILFDKLIDSVSGDQATPPLPLPTEK